jgi:hypothetical protein
MSLFLGTAFMGDGSQFLTNELERLMKLPLKSKEDIRHWDNEAHKLQAVLAERFPKFEFPHHILHFLDDADIRERDSDYGDAQHKKISDYIAQVRTTDAV